MYFINDTSIFFLKVIDNEGNVSFSLKVHQKDNYTLSKRIMIKT